jgi:phosphopentomutase
LGNASEILGNTLPGCEAIADPAACYGVMQERSPGKDTTTGHWEIAGITLDKAFATFPPDYPSFPKELTRAFEERTGREILGNKAASGTVIIEELGEEHERTGGLICYTSGDSVFQIAAHEEVIPVEDLYRICEIARELCDPYYVARIIARPFVGKAGAYERTTNRRDFSIALPRPSVMEIVQNQGVRTVGVGKIGDIFNELGLTESYHDKGNEACLDRTRSLLSAPSTGNELIFVNLVDTDMIYGHRRDVEGYFAAVSRIDDALDELLDLVRDEDLLIITADHGCDPTFRGTDHTREYVPLLSFGGGHCGKHLGIRDTFADIAQTLVQCFNIPEMPVGTGFFAR